MHDNNDITAILSGLVVDLRRGTMTLAVLSSLSQAKYGYSLLQDMEDRGIHIEANTLYPLLRRLEAQGLLESQWDTGESRPRKYYTLSVRGEILLIQLRDEWRHMVAEMEAFLGNL